MRNSRVRSGPLKEHIAIKGSLIAVVSPLGKKANTFALTIKRHVSAQEPDEYETESGGKVAASLTTSIASGPFEASGLEDASPTLASGQEYTIN